MKKLSVKVLTQAAGKAGLFLQKRSPLLLTIGGVIGLGATAVLAYKAAPRIDEIINDVEDKRNAEQEYMKLKAIPLADLDETGFYRIKDLEKDPASMMVDRVEVAKNIAGAIAAPVLTGMASICAITLSYYILNHRVGSLAAAVATLGAERAANEKFMRKSLGNDKYDELMKAQMQEDVTYKKVDKETGEVVDENAVGKRIVKKQNLTGVWFTESDEYVSDDHAYNIEYIRSVTDRMGSKLSYRGYIYLNEVLDALGCARIKEGATMGWSIADNFDIYTDVINDTDQYGEAVPKIYTKWPMPRFIFEETDYDGHYSVL